MSIDARSRQPKGQPTGGQFATEAKTDDELGSLTGVAPGNLILDNDLDPGTPADWKGAYVVSDTGVPFNVRYIPAGSHHYNFVTGEYTRPVDRDLVVFFDARYGLSPHGQHVSTYMVDDWCGGDATRIALDGGTPEWTIDAQSNARIREWLTLATDAQAETNRLITAARTSTGSNDFDRIALDALRAKYATDYDVLPYMDDAIDLTGYRRYDDDRAFAEAIIANPDDLESIGMTADEVRANPEAAADAYMEGDADGTVFYHEGRYHFFIAD